MSNEKPKDPEPAPPKPEPAPQPIAKPAEPANVIIREGEAPRRDDVIIDRLADDQPKGDS